MLIELGWPAKALSPNHRSRQSPHRFWTDEEIALVRHAYARATCGEDIGLDAISEKIGRHKSLISRKALSLGLTDANRPMKRQRKQRRKIGPEGSPELRAHQSAIRREWFKNNPHPRGYLGRKHGKETRRKLGEKSAAAWARMTPDERAAHTLKGLKSKVARYGSVNGTKDRCASWKAGWREIGGKRHYFRSRWEANYARYLEWLKARGKILEWEYEPETFWFEKIKRGVRSYLPDFRVHELDGSKPLHEVKGWMDARSRTTLKRMAKYHPDQTIILIREKDYKAISRSVGPFISGWE